MRYVASFKDDRGLSGIIIWSGFTRHQEDMKNVVKCWKEFFAYFNALSVQSLRIFFAVLYKVEPANSFQCSEI